MELNVAQQLMGLSGSCPVSLHVLTERRVRGTRLLPRWHCEDCTPTASALGQPAMLTSCVVHGDRRDGAPVSAMCPADTLCPCRTTSSLTSRCPRS